jgi:hypothetical protein
MGNTVEYGLMKSQVFGPTVRAKVKRPAQKCTRCSHRKDHHVVRRPMPHGAPAYNRCDDCLKSPDYFQQEMRFHEFWPRQDEPSESVIQ